MRDRRFLFVISVLGLLVLAVAFGAATPVAAADCGGATPCSCGDNVTDSRTLVCGVDPVTTAPCPGNGLTLNTDSVNLNLGGCIITGSGGGSGILIEALVDEVTVQFGKLTGFGVGVLAEDTVSSTIAGLQVYGNQDGLDLTASLTTIRNNVVGPNWGDGLFLRNGAFSEDENSVTGNRAVNNGGRGIVIRGRKNGVSHNVSLRNAEAGWDIGGDESTTQQNRAEYNLGDGFVIEGFLHALSLNRSTANGGDGYANSSRASTFDRNRGDHNDGFGFVDTTIGGGTGMTANTYTGNRCAGNAAGRSSPPGLCQ